MSRGSPMMSLSTMAYTWAGAQSRANFPPFTELSRFRTVFMDTISAPLANRSEVMSWSSFREIRGFSKRAEPPPLIKNSTVSSAVRSLTRSMARWVAFREFSSGTGWPASQISRGASSPLLWPYLVITIPLEIRPSRIPTAVLAICQAAFPMATTTIFPLPNSLCSKAFATAASGSEALMASSIMVSASVRNVMVFSPSKYCELVSL